MHVIATAGHVDHGKSSLVKALTGIDPDRLEEEKRRGLTIDLGFAWIQLPSGRNVGIVDVPGHERFIKNMLAGVGATDVALFVVAANEGWKPQSQEHLDILDLLGFSTGIIVITKSDTVSEKQVHDLTDDVLARVRQTSLAGSPIMAVSARTGQGLPELLKSLDDVVGQASPAQDLGRPRLWIDRAFSIKGSGTVVTGTLLEGALTEDQEVEIVNKGTRARIRTIQSHRSEVARIGPGNRTALNLVSIDRETIDRGDVLSSPGSWVLTQGFVAELRFLDLGFDPNDRGAFKIYHGSAELDCSLTFIGPPAERGGHGFVACRILGPPHVASFGDRIILRDSGRRITLAGGTIIEPFLQNFGSPKSNEAVTRARSRADAQAVRGYMAVLLDESEGIKISEALLMTGLEKDALPGILTKTFVVSEKTHDEIRSRVMEQVRDYQVDHPVEPGIPRTQIKAGSAPQITEEILELLITQGQLQPEGTFVRTPDHQPQTETPEALHLLNAVNAAGFSPPTVAELNQQYDPSLIRSLVRNGRLVQIDRDIVISSDRLQQLFTAVRELALESDGFTVAGFRDRVGTTRKYAVPMLEYLDSTKFTVRQQDVRILGPAARPSLAEDGK